MTEIVFAVLETFLACADSSKAFRILSSMFLDAESCFDFSNTCSIIFSSQLMIKVLSDYYCKDSRCQGNDCNQLCY